MSIIERHSLLASIQPTYAQRSMAGNSGTRLARAKPIAPISEETAERKRTAHAPLDRAHGQPSTSVAQRPNSEPAGSTIAVVVSPSPVGGYNAHNSAAFLTQVLAQEIMPEERDEVPAHMHAGIAHYQAAVDPEISVIGPANAPGVVL